MEKVSFNVGEYMVSFLGLYVKFYFENEGYGVLSYILVKGF